MRKKIKRPLLLKESLRVLIFHGGEPEPGALTSIANDGTLISCSLTPCSRGARICEV
jgi:hypothetical protein